MMLLILHESTCSCSFQSPLHHLGSLTDVGSFTCSPLFASTYMTVAKRTYGKENLRDLKEEM